MTDFTCAQATDVLPAMVRGALTGDDLARVERHVSTCTSCSEEAALIRRVRLAIPTAPDGLANEIKQALASDRARSRWVTRWHLPAAATVVLALGTAVIWQRTQTVTESSQFAQESFVMAWSDADAQVADAPMLEDLSEEELSVLLEELGG